MSSNSHDDRFINIEKLLHNDPWPQDLLCTLCPLTGVCPGHQELKGAVPCKNYLSYTEWKSTIRIKDLDD